jgi:hypothetical protein
MLMSTFLHFYAAYNRHESENMKVLCADTDSVVRSENVAPLILKISAKWGGVNDQCHTPVPLPPRKQNLKYTE